MAMCAYVLCEICEGQDIMKRADHWCPECEGGLCSECLRHHSISKASRSHQVILVENFKKLPKHISEIAHHCQEHDRKYQNYCPNHESLCCPVCIATNHKECIGLLVIDDIIKTAKASSLLESLEEDLSDLKRNAKKILEDINANGEKNKQLRDKFVCDIKQARSVIIGHFDKLEEGAMKEVQTTEQKIQQDNARHSLRLEERLKEIEEIERDITAIQEYASDLQTCLGSMEVKKRVEQEGKLMQSFVEKDLTQVLLICSVNDQMLTMMSSITSFGSVSTEKSPSTVRLTTEKAKRAQIVSQPLNLLIDINGIILTQKCIINFPKNLQSKISGCIIDHNGKIMLTYNSIPGKLLVFNDTGTMEKQMDLSHRYPEDVAIVDDNTICVSYYSYHCLELINTDTYCTTQIIQTKNGCFGVTFCDGTLFWCEIGYGIQMMQIASDAVTTLIKLEDIIYGSYIAVFADKIYHTRETLHTVTCYNINGEKTWEFKDESAILGPKGIAVDNDSHVYVSSNTQDKVVVISADGQKCRQLLGKNNGLDQPYALHFNRKLNILLVSNLYGPVFIYHVSK